MDGPDHTQPPATSKASLQERVESYFNEHANLTNVAFAAKCKVSGSTIAKVRTGKKIRAAMQVRIEAVLGGRVPEGDSEEDASLNEACQTMMDSLLTLAEGNNQFDHLVESCLRRYLHQEDTQSLRPLAEQVLTTYLLSLEKDKQVRELFKLYEVVKEKKERSQPSR